LKSLRDARQILRSSPMQKGLNSEEYGSLRVASAGVLRAARTHQGDAQRAVALHPV
jgi:hypothetical protein